ncbi:MAG: HAD family hydrolase [Planctomycetes bacterium]|nr:HAD family hydrolase [Planctomycetota bacterium]
MRREPMITAIIFDLDDTLYDEVDYCRSGFRELAKYVAAMDGNEAVTAETTYEALTEQFDRGNRTETINAALDALDIEYDTRLIRRLIVLYRRHTPKITLSRESRVVLETLSQEFTLGMLTDGYLPAQRLKVRALKIQKFFRCILYTEQMGREFWKPSPAGFEKLAETLETAPEQMIYVGDNAQKDFIAPKQLGFTTIQVIRPRRVHTEEASDPAAAAQHRLSALSQLPNLMRQLNRPMAASRTEETQA